MKNIGVLVEQILPEAIERVSSGGKMKFSARNLFYAVREIFLKSFPEEQFYKDYDNFTQGFLRRYERKHGKIPGLVRERRGFYAYPTEQGKDYEYSVEPGLTLCRGIANKIIAIEKEGLYSVMKENRFDIRLEAIIITTQGFTTEAGRELLIQAEETGLPVCVLHDYDVNGVLIHKTLTRPTQRLDIHVSKVVDLGLNWKIVKKLMDERGLIPEPVILKKEDLGKLEGMKERGEITYEEYEFLKKYRVELNALTPTELIEWLEQRLKELKLWKTVPTQEQLDEEFKVGYTDTLRDVRSALAYEFKNELAENLGLQQIHDSVLKVMSNMYLFMSQKIQDYLNNLNIEIPGVNEFKELMEKNMNVYWKKLCHEMAKNKAEKDTETIKDKIFEDKPKLIESAKQQLRDEILNFVREAREVLNRIEKSL